MAGSPLREILEGRRRGAVLGKNLRRHCLEWGSGRTPMMLTPMTFILFFCFPLRLDLATDESNHINGDSSQRIPACGQKARHQGRSFVTALLESDSILSF